jgi:hypothetical protein
MADLKLTIDAVLDSVASKAPTAGAEELAYLGTAVERVSGKVTIGGIIETGDIKKLEITELTTASIADIVTSLDDAIVVHKPILQETIAVGIIAGVATIDLSLGDHFLLSITEDVTITLTGKSLFNQRAMLHITYDGISVVSWADNVGFTGNLTRLSAGYNQFEINVPENDFDAAYGEALFTTVGTHTINFPPAARSFCAVCVGGGGAGSASTSGGIGGGGGGLGWVNNILIDHSRTYTAVVGAGGTAGGIGTNGSVSQVLIDGATVVVAGNGGTSPTGYNSGDTGFGGAFIGHGGGNGGNGGTNTSTAAAGGGGGAGGYSGAGGDGGAGAINVGSRASSGAGGGGGGGGCAGSVDTAGAGGGVGLYGQGASGLGGFNSSADGNGGQGGSGGGNATAYNTAYTATDHFSTSVKSTPGLYGGGGAGADITGENDNGADGAVRVIWSPFTKFPSTNVAGTHVSELRTVSFFVFKTY